MFPTLPMPRALFWLLLVLMLAGFGWLAVQANTDLIMGRYALFIDETITFNGVHKILHARSIEDFFFQVTDGNYHRYGRILWNTMAIGSAVPAAIGGDSWQIAAGRLTQTLILFAAYMVLVWALIRNNGLRLLALFCLLVMPYSHYYQTLPKPEPQQLLALALFFLFYQKRAMGFGRYWFFLGVALGAKISTLPVVVIIAVCTLLQESRHQTVSAWLPRLLQAVNYLLLGLAVAIPILFVLWCAYLSLYLAWRYRELLPVNRYLVMAVALVFAAGFAYLAIDPVSRWLGQTILKTGHVSDLASIGPWSWLQFWATEWMISPLPINLLFVVAALLPLLVLLRAMVQRRALQLSPASVAVLCGLALNAAIFVSAERLWGIYLFVGTLLCLIGLLALIETSWSAAPAGHKETTLNRVAGAPFLVLLLVISVVYWLPEHYRQMQALATRTQTELHRQQQTTYNQLMRFLDRHAARTASRFTVMMPPLMFQPASNAEYVVRYYWDYYLDWEQRAEVIVLPAFLTPAVAPMPREGSPRRPYYQPAMDGYRRHVVARGEPCTDAICYERVVVLADDSEILLMKRGGHSAD